MLKRFFVALTGLCVLAVPAFAGYMRSVYDTQYLSPFLERLVSVAPNHPLLTSFVYTEAPEVFSYENINRMVEKGKCSSYRTQGEAVGLFVDMGNRVLVDSNLTAGTRVAFEFGQLIGEAGFLFCREEKSGWMSWSDHYYFMSNDGGFRIRFVLTEKD